MGTDPGGIKDPLTVVRRAMSRRRVPGEQYSIMKLSICLHTAIEQFEFTGIMFTGCEHNLVMTMPGITVPS